jgi:hypothetical protein
MKAGYVGALFKREQSSVGRTQVKAVVLFDYFLAQDDVWMRIAAELLQALQLKSDNVYTLRQKGSIP